MHSKPKHETFILLKCRYYPGQMVVRDNYGNLTPLGELEVWMKWCRELPRGIVMRDAEWKDHFYYIEVPVNAAGGAIPFEPGTERVLAEEELRDIEY